MKNAYRFCLPITVVAAMFSIPAAHAQQDAVAPVESDASPARLEAAASRHVNDAVEVVHKLENDARMRSAIGRAKGIFIIPSYGRAAVGVGAAGGTGLLLVRRSDGSWSDPAFYTTGGLSLGLQAGAQGGAFVMLLNNDKAIKEFYKKNNFSINANAGLTVLNWSRMAEGTAGTGDVLVWSDTKGLFGDLVTVELNDLRYSNRMNNAYYRRTLAAPDVVAGKVENPQADSLVRAVAAVNDTRK